MPVRILPIPPAEDTWVHVPSPPSLRRPVSEVVYMHDETGPTHRRRSLPHPPSTPSSAPPPPYLSPNPNTPYLSRSPSPSHAMTAQSVLSAQPPQVYSPPSTTSLSSSVPDLDRAPDTVKLAWAQDVVRVLDRYLYPSGVGSDPTSTLSKPASSSKLRRDIPPDLLTLLATAIPIIISLSADPRTSAVAALATYLKAKLLAAGCCPEYLPRDQRQAFKDFEAAARAGESRGWFKLGRDYESVGDVARARDCFQRGVKRDDCESTYRMGMAHLLGQLGLSSDPATALPLLHHASELGDVDFPIPPYVYGMLLAGELVSPTSIPSHLVIPPTAPPSDALASQHSLARAAIERAAYLGHPPAQYKCGFISEHATLGCVYDPLMSVQWYSLASQGGEVEADMALSKWFLCGADPHFQKNEELARTFAEKAARKGHPNGCFAMGYYFELGIGGRRDMDQARRWYQKAAKLDNPDAIARLAALAMPHPAVISLQEHQTRLDNTLVRRRTQAKLRSDRNSIRRTSREDLRARPLSTPTPRPTGTPWPTPVGDRRPSAASSTDPTPYPYPSPQSSFSRPPIPEQFNTASSAATAATVGVSVNIASHLASPRPPLSPSPGAQGLRHGSLPEREAKRYTLTDSGSAVSAPVAGERRRRDDGPQTFAEMGFQSKPVEEEGCVVM